MDMFNTTNSAALAAIGPRKKPRLDLTLGGQVSVYFRISLYFFVLIYIVCGVDYLKSTLYIFISVRVA